MRKIVIRALMCPAIIIACAFGAGAQGAGYSSADQDQAAVASKEFKEKVAITQSVILKDPQMLQEVAQLAADPAFQQLLKDPEIVSAIKSGDTAALLKNAKFIEIMNNAKIQGMARQIANKTGSQQ